MQNYYLNSSGTLQFDGSITGGSVMITVPLNQGIHPTLAFKYIKKKFNLLERTILDRRLKKLEQAWEVAMENGQDRLGNKILNELAIEAKESEIYAKGIRHYIERDELMQVKHMVRDGHISDTILKEYTRVIPKDVLKKKRSVEGIFDDFVILHYYNNKLEEKLSKKQKMSNEEISKMKDPILLGIIKETNRLYFIADWEDEYCDLTFDEILEVVTKNKIEKNPVLNA